MVFIATANSKAVIPGPLLDRMEVIDLPGYMLDEKIAIGMRHLVPRQLEQHGLLPQVSHRNILRGFDFISFVFPTCICTYLPCRRWRSRRRRFRR